MKNEILARCLWAQRIIANPEGIDLDRAEKDLARWIGYFQHERLIHLIVTALFAVLTVVSLVLMALVPSYTVITLIVLLATLLVFYIRHYYILENRTQHLYKLMDRLLEVKSSELGQD
jgi:predicted PurR-regulated permease PerM